MAYDPGALEAALAAAVGDEPQLILDLRGAFLTSASAHLTALRTAIDRDAWEGRARRLHGLAASFGALRVMDAARTAGAAPVGDRRALSRVEHAIEALRDKIV